MEIVWAIVVGLVAGYLAGLFTKGKGFDFIGSLVIGVIGAVVGTFLFGALGIRAYNLIGRIAIAFVGAVVFLAVIKSILKRR